MTPSEKYPIEQYIMTQNDCYKANKRRKPTGIQVHSVGCKGTTRERWRVWNVKGLKKCANAFVDLNGIMQTLDWDVRPWLSGSGNKGNANDTCVGFEICEPATSKDTPEAAAYLFGCVKYLCTELCRDYNINPANIKCHCELHREGRASNHADVNHWWGKKGTSWEQYTMTRLRKEVADALGVELKESIMRTLKYGMNGEDVRQLQEMLNALGYICGKPDGVFGGATQKAVRAFQNAEGIKADAIAGPQTLALLAARAAKPTQPELPEDDDEIDAPSTVVHLTFTEAAAIRDALKKALDALEKAMGHSK